jgi:uncharacterized protein YdcH (DUF465 family)
MNGAVSTDPMLELEARHRHLHEEVNRLERQSYLSPNEQHRVAELKKQKLAAKDQLYAARRRESERPPS